MRSNPNKPKGNPTAKKGKALDKPTPQEQAIIDNKVNEVAILLAKGVSQKQIRVQKSEEWQCTEQNVHYFIKKAMQAMQSSIEKKLDYVLAVQRERLEYILNGAVEKKDYQSAQKIIDTMNKLYGLYEEKKNIKIDAPTIKFDFGNINNSEEKDDEVSE